MKNASIAVSLCVCLVLGFAAVLGGEAIAGDPQPATHEDTLAGDEADRAVPMGSKKCNFDSDCPYGKCGKGQCGACNFNSDCKGFGICKGGQCGACNFDSECKAFGKCSGGRCTKSPW